MAYNPGIQDRSGEILAQGMMNRSRGISQAITQTLDTWNKREEQRAKSAGVIKGMMGNPFVQKTVAGDPELQAKLQKVVSGKGKESDIHEILGVFASAKEMGDQSMRERQLKMEEERNRFLNQQAEAQAAYIKGQKDALAKAEADAAKRAAAVADAVRPFTPGEAIMGGAPFGSIPDAARQPTTQESLRRIMSSGVPLDAPTINAIKTAAELEQFDPMMRQKAEALRAKDLLEREKLGLTRRGVEVRERAATGPKGEFAMYEATLMGAVAAGRLKPEEADALLKKAYTSGVPRQSGSTALTDFIDEERRRLSEDTDKTGDRRSPTDILKAYNID